MTEFKDFQNMHENTYVLFSLKPVICAFLNAKGGRIYIGVEDKSMKVVGCQLNSKQRDLVKCKIDDLLKDFEPRVKPEEVRTVFIPVKNQNSKISI